MAKDVADVLGTAIGRMAREAAKTVSENNGRHRNITDRVGGAVSGSMNKVPGSKGVAAGVGIAAAVPLAAKGVGKLVGGIGSDGAGPVGKVGQKLGSGAKGAAKSATLGTVAKGAAKSAKRGKRGKGGKSQGVPGVGKGRRMPVQQDIDIGAPLDMVYERWVQFEEWPEFMHRIDNVSQEDDKHVSFKTKIWGLSKEFRAEIVEHQPRERIKWEVNEGVTHTGVVTFHELGPRLTRVEVNLDVEPGSLIEKAARGMRHVKRAVRADLARFKAFVLMQEPKASRSRSSSRSSASSRSASSRTASSGSRGRSSSSRKSSSSGSSRRSTSGSRKRSTARSSSSKGRSSSSRTTASSNGRSSSGRARASSSNGRSRSSAKKRSGSRS
jgi:uncharacterized membrane protein